MLIYAVNPLGVILAAFATMILGMLWYSPVMFGNTWMRLVGMTSELREQAKKSAQKSYIFMTISSFVMAYVLALFIKNMFAPDVVQSVIIAFTAWIGFVATSLLTEFLFSPQKKPFALYFLNSGYYLAALVINAIILSLFLK